MNVYAFAPNAYTERANQEIQLNLDGTSGVRVLVPRNYDRLPVRDDLQRALDNLVTLMGGPPQLANPVLVIEPGLEFPRWIEGEVAYVSSAASDIHRIAALASFWLDGNSLAQTWMHLGLADAVAILAAAKSGYGVDAQSYVSKLQPLLNASQSDRPLELVDYASLDPDGFAIFNAKSTGFALVLAATLGRAKFEQLLSALRTTAKPVDTESLIQMSSDIAGKSLQNIFTGWVLKGNYTSFTPDDLADTDHDGLINVFESYVQTHSKQADTDNDGISDGAEFYEGIDPTGTTEADKNSAGLVADGLGRDWSAAPDYDDPRGDSAVGLDMTQLWVGINAQSQDVCIKAKLAPGRINPERTGILVYGKAANGQQVVYQAERSYGPVTRQFNGKREVDRGARFVVIEVAEICLPKPQLAVEKWNVQLLLDNQVADHMGAWWIQKP